MGFGTPAFARGKGCFGIGLGIVKIKRAAGGEGIARGGGTDEQAGGLQMLIPGFAAVEGWADLE